MASQRVEYPRCMHAMHPTFCQPTSLSMCNISQPIYISLVAAWLPLIDWNEALAAAAEVWHLLIGTSASPIDDSSGYRHQNKQTSFTEKTINARESTTVEVSDVETVSVVTDELVTLVVDVLTFEVSILNYYKKVWIIYFCKIMWPKYANGAMDPPTWATHRIRAYVG